MRVGVRIMGGAIGEEVRARGGVGMRDSVG